MGWWKKTKDWLNSRPDDRGGEMVSWQEGHNKKDRLPARGNRQKPGGYEWPDMFKDAPPELIRCVLDGGTINVEGRSFESVVEEMKRDPSILGATGTIEDEHGQAVGKMIIWRNKKTGEVEISRELLSEREQQKHIGRNNVRQIGR